MIVGREALSRIPPDVIALGRLIGGGSIFFLLAGASRTGKIHREDWGRIVICGIVGAASNQLFLVHGLARSTATNASILSTTIPILTVLAGWLFGVERIRAARLAGIGVALAGALILVGVERLASGDRYLLGNVMILMNCLSWALFLVLVRRLVPRYAPMRLASYLFAVGTLVALPICLPSVIEFAPRLTLTDLLYIAFIILVPTVGAYALNQVALRRAEPSLVAAHWYLLPLFGTAGALLRLGERPGLGEAVAATLICFGLFLSSRRLD